MMILRIMNNNLNKISLRIHSLSNFNLSKISNIVIDNLYDVCKAYKDYSGVTPQTHKQNSRFRPLSPHITVYGYHCYSLMSILSRICLIVIGLAFIFVGFEQANMVAPEVIFSNTALLAYIVDLMNNTSEYFNLLISVYIVSLLQLTITGQIINSILKQIY